MTQSEDAASATDLTIAAAVTTLRQHEGTTVDQLAVYAGLNRASLYRKLKGAVAWKATDVAALSSYFGVEPGDLFRADPPLPTSRGRMGSTGGCSWWRALHGTRGTRPTVTLRHLA